MYNLVHVGFDTAIPTFKKKCFLYLFVHFFGILTKDVVLANVFQMLANKSEFSATTGSRAPPKSPRLD